MKQSIELKETFPVKAAVLYHAWLDSSEHTKMTGGEAACSNQVGGTFTAWDEYISGRNIALKANEAIIQSWRTTEFSEEEPDSTLNLRFKEVEGGTEITLSHSDIPDGQSDYEKGWIEHYFTPMKAYFGG